MKVRRLVVAFAALIAGPAAWVASAEPAHAGGPTSVLLIDPNTGRAAALYHSSPDYQELVDVVGAFESSTATTDRPAAISENTNADYRFTWLIHDVSAWRVDSVFITSDDKLWIQTRQAGSAGDAGDVFANPARWTEMADPNALKGVLARSGLLGEPVTDGAPNVTVTAPPPAVDPSGTRPAVASAAANPAVPVGAGLLGLLVGAGGMVLLHRVRSTQRAPHAALSG